MQRSLVTAATLLVCCFATGAKTSADELKNAAFHLSVAAQGGDVIARLEDVVTHRELADGPYFYRAAKADEKEKACTLDHAGVASESGKIVIRGQLAGLDLEQTFSLPAERPIMEERIVLRNGTKAAVALADFEAGLTLRVTDAAGKVLRQAAGDHWAAVPFLRRADFGEGRLAPPPGDSSLCDPRDIEYDFPLRAILDEPGFQYIPVTWVMDFAPKRVPCPHRFSEGWAWIQGKRTIGIFSFNQEHMVFATVTPHDSPQGKRLRFGGGCLLESTLSALRNVQPGQSIDLGITRFQPVEGGYNETSYAFRSMLDEKGCRFPKDYNPLVHWNQLYDMGGWDNRKKTHTREAYDKEAAKGVEFHCEALYLDPGWDTSFGSFIWGPWLGSQEEFIDLIKSRYGLKSGLHCPMPPWASGTPEYLAEWPEACRRQPGKPPAPGARVCMGSKQFLDEAEKRLLKVCEAGAVFLMFDGTWWNGRCFDERHGHPIPYTYEDHMRACVELARRVHAKYPKVLIEMHDMLAGGEWRRMTPVYYKYGLPLSYDDNWGFELMWSPMMNLMAGTSDALYYYALGCNVPMYLHIRLDDDNQYAVSLWWYASTCRHLGIGGKSKIEAVVKAHEEAMQRYRQWEDFYKRGEFFGIDREIHIHALPARRAFVVNVFNLSKTKRTIQGSIELKTMGVDPSLEYVSRDGLGSVERGRYRVRVELPPGGAKVGIVESATPN